MHEVFYNTNEKFLLTDEEFLKAMTSWDQGKSFYCMRLQALLPRFITYAKKPRWEVDSEMFILQGENGAWSRAYLRNGVYHQLVSYNGVEKLSAHPDLQKKETIAKLIPQEEFFRDKKYVI